MLTISILGKDMIWKLIKQYFWCLFFQRMWNGQASVEVWTRMWCAFCGYVRMRQPWGRCWTRRSPAPLYDDWPTNHGNLRHRREKLQSLKTNSTNHLIDYIIRYTCMGPELLEMSMLISMLVKKTFLTWLLIGWQLATGQSEAILENLC